MGGRDTYLLPVITVIAAIPLIAPALDLRRAQRGGGKDTEG